MTQLQQQPDSASGVAAPTRVPVIRHAYEGRATRAFGNEILFKLGGHESGGELTVGLAGAPAGGGPPLHVHHAEDELFLVLEGTYRVYVEGAWTEAGPGALVYLPRGIPHTFQVTEDGPGKHWVITTPSGFDRYFAACEAVFAEPGPPDIARISAINAEFHNEILGKPGTRP